MHTDTRVHTDGHGVHGEQLTGRGRRQGYTAMRICLDLLVLGGGMVVRGGGYAAKRICPALFCWFGEEWYRFGEYQHWFGAEYGFAEHQYFFRVDLYQAEKIKELARINLYQEEEKIKELIRLSTDSV
eukprot:3890757-Rhodomonas_salina.1